MTTSDHTITREDHRTGYDNIWSAVKADYEMIVTKVKPGLIEHELRMMVASKVAVHNATARKKLEWGAGSSHIYICTGTWLGTGPGSDYSRILIIQFKNNY